jgi:hypothetical protein
MSMALQMSVESGALYVTASGNFSLAEAQRTFLEMIGAVAQNKVGKVFFDGREVEGNPELMERFYFGEFAARTVVDHGLSCLRFACVLKEPLLDPGRFGENVAVNRGMQIKAFDDFKEAQTWLEIAPAKEPAE